MLFDLMVILLLLAFLGAALDYYFDIIDLLHSKEDWKKARQEYKRWKKHYKRERERF